MRPMNKRIFRDLRENIGRYIGLFLLTVLAIGMLVGYMEGINSSLDIFDNYIEDNNLEDGLVETQKQMSDIMINDIEDIGVKLYENFYFDADSVNDSTLRVFNERKDIDLPCAVEGSLPSSDDEIFLDQLYASEQDIKTGDSIEVNGKEYTVSGIGCFPDYTISISSQTEMLADRREFGVASVTESAFEKIAGEDVCYNYSYKFNDSDLSDEEQKQLSYEILKTVSCAVSINDYNNLTESFKKMADGNSVINSTSILNNKRIATVHSKLESNKSMALMFVGVVLLIVAFIYTIISSHSIQRESKIIGTLRALGYKKLHITLHYVMLPAFITLVSAIVGSILGITYFSQIPIKSMTSYYSLPDMTSVNVEAAPIIWSILIPLLLICIVNFIFLYKMLSLKPLRLLRNDWSKAGIMKKGSFNFLPFKIRFNLRMFTRNIGMYVVLFVGIFLASWLMIFGLGMSSITSENLVKSGEVLKNSMQSMITMFPVLACIVYLVMMFLVIKIIIEKNKTGISMLKIFGFRYREVKRMYITLITIAVFVSVIVSMPLGYLLMQSMWPSAIKTISGFFEFKMYAKGFVILFVTGIAAYFITMLMNLKAIRKIPPTLVLKNQDE